MSAMTLSQLKAKWKTEQDSYRVREVGSGVQKFVKDALACPDLFGLREGFMSTAVEKRSKEFLEEQPNRGGLADVVIYVTPEVVVPVEIERFGNIAAGEGQLLAYQLALDKRYGLLTDGWLWRFYNNNAYREWTLWIAIWN